MGGPLEIRLGKIASYNAITGMAVAEMEGSGRIKFKSVDYSSKRPPSFPGAGVLIDVVYVGGEMVLVRERN